MSKNNDKESEEKKEMTSPSSSSGLVSFDELDHFFDDFLTRRWPRLSEWNFPTTFERGFPKIDIIDHDNEIEVQAELPGVSKEDLDVSINNQSITIRTTTQKEKKQEGKYFRREITRGEFQRTLALPDNIDSDNAKASFKNGLLTLIIPKTKTSKRKKIEIK